MRTANRLSVLPLLVLAVACAAGAPPPTPTNGRSWTEEEVTLNFGALQLAGVLTLPTGGGPYPAVVLVSGSINTTTGVRSGASSRYFTDHARRMALRGFAVLRYDPPGVGRSAGEAGFETLDLRTEEVAAAVRTLRSRPDIHADRVGLHGNSQGAWVVAMVAARYPQEVAFIISVSGAGVSVAEQQVHSIEAQSGAAGMSETDVTKAVLFGRLLVDWQLTDPIYRPVNEADARALGDGPWTRFLELVYEPGQLTPGESLTGGIEILRSIRDEPWAEFLYLELYLSQLESIPADQVEALRAMTGPTLLEDPEDYWTQVRCPVLAVFGEEDLLQPTATSAARYEGWLAQAGNEHFEILVLPDAGHAILLSTPGYWDGLSRWLDRLYIDPILLPKPKAVSLKCLLDFDSRLR